VASTPLAGTVDNSAFVPQSVLLFPTDANDDGSTLAMADAPLACPPPNPGGEREVVYPPGARSLEMCLSFVPGAVCEFDANGTCAAGTFYDPSQPPPDGESPAAGRLEYESLAGNVASLRVRADAVMYSDTLAGGLEGQIEGAVEATVCP
jgi:hypothetical protein